ncbi:MAG: acyl-CoA dehydrogenase family protein [Actinomycetota bacterium]
MSFDHYGFTEDQRALIGLVAEFSRREIAPYAADWERKAEFPRATFRKLGDTGVFGAVYSEEFGGFAQPTDVYLLCLEEIAAGSVSMGIATSVQVLTIYPVSRFGTDAQRKTWMPNAISGEMLGSYSLSEPESGSDASALTTKAIREGDSYVINGRKAWVTHGGISDYILLMARTGEPGPNGISAFMVHTTTPGIAAAKIEHKMGAMASPTAQMIWEGVRVPEDQRIGDEGDGFRIALSALDAGRLGIAACSIGVARAAFEAASTFAKERKQFGRPVIENQGLSFMLADMLTGIESSRALTLDAARRRDAGVPFATHAAMAKLAASDMAMRVTTDAVQIHGGYGYVDEFPVERFMREAKVMQIVEGTNQIQRLVIGRAISKS